MPDRASSLCKNRCGGYAIPRIAMRSLPHCRNGCVDRQSPQQGMQVLETLDRRGKATLDFLDYCVRSMQLDPLFVVLVEEYRANPTIPKAVALFHTFCAPGALAKVSVNPDEGHVQAAMRPISVSWTRMQAALVFGPGNGAPPMPPPMGLFDRVAEAIIRAGIITRL